MADDAAGARRPAPHSALVDPSHFASAGLLSTYLLELPGEELLFLLVLPLESYLFTVPTLYKKGASAEHPRLSKFQSMLPVRLMPLQTSSSHNEAMSIEFQLGILSKACLE